MTNQPLQENWEKGLKKLLEQHEGKPIWSTNSTVKNAIKSFISTLFKEREERVCKEMKDLILSIAADEANIAREEDVPTSRITSMTMKLLKSSLLNPKE